jgi:hypothetical protein
MVQSISRSGVEATSPSREIEAKVDKSLNWLRPRLVGLCQRFVDAPRTAQNLETAGPSLRWGEMVLRFANKCIAFWEVATTATVSTPDRKEKRLVTVTLGCPPSRSSVKPR